MPIRNLTVLWCLYWEYVCALAIKSLGYFKTVNNADTPINPLLNSSGIVLNNYPFGATCTVKNGGVYTLGVGVYIRKGCKS